LELSRTHAIGSLIALGAVAATAVGVATLRRRPDQVQGHAFAIPSGDDRIQVEVLNGTTRPGLARTATRVLRRQGVDGVFFGPTDSAGRSASTLILVRRSAPGIGERVAEALGQGKALVRLDTLRRVDASVILGNDYKGPDEVHP
jgi:2-keto-3-deoxy-L-rhamnonate aldolase RhmA